MSNSALKIGRRHFLTGLGGFTLAIPFLPSLEKRASATGTTATPRFFYLGTDHGGCWDANFFPTVSMTQSTTVVPGHTVTAGTLSAPVTNGNAVLSPVLTANSAKLTTQLLGKMNVLRGLDIPWYIAHNTGQHLGNFARNDGNGDDGTAVAALGNRPTIDQIMALSPEFYSTSDLASTTLKTMVIDSGRMLSYQLLDPSMGPAGGVSNYQGLDSSLQLFSAVFGNAPSGMATRPPVVDRILANYNSLLQGNTRLSALDKQRLQAHIQMLSELQSSLNAQISCTAPTRPTTDAQSLQGDASGGTSVQAGQLWLDIVAAAFACNASRIGVYGFGGTSNLSGGASGTGAYIGCDWHHDVAHQWYLDQPQTWLTNSYQQVFEQLLVYLASKLDQMQDGNGQTVLDNSLLVWSQECCMETHMSYGIQTVTFGGAAGAMNTGLLCDYRNLSESGMPISPVNDAGPTTSANTALTGYTTMPGLLWEQWLATELQLMGVPPSEFELWTDSSGNTQHGYGTPYLDTNLYGNTYFGDHYVSLSSPYYANASNILPFLAKM